METLGNHKMAGLIIGLLTLVALARYFEISPVIVASGVVALVVLSAALVAMLRPQVVYNPWPSQTGQIPDNELAAMAIRNQVFFRTRKASFTDDRPQPIDEDIPAGGPLFNSICYHLGQSWQLYDISISVWHGLLSAHLGIGATILFELVLMEFDDGWMLIVQPKKDATAERIRQFPSGRELGARLFSSV